MSPTFLVRTPFSYNLLFNYRVPVDPHKISGQNLFKQYAGKEGKAVLDARWVNECIKANALLTWQTSWGGCKVTGSEP